MSLSWSSSVTSPVAISLMPDLSRPRSPNCFMNAAPCPEGRNTNTASGFKSATFCRNGAKSGLFKGVRISPMIWPPLSWNSLLKNFSASTPGP